MEKKVNKYHITLTLLETAKGEHEGSKQLDFDVENHDEVFGIIERVVEKDPFENKQQATEFALGLKLFSEVMIKNREHPLFEELRPAFQMFMKRLKSL